VGANADDKTCSLRLASGRVLDVCGLRPCVSYIYHQTRGGSLSFAMHEGSEVICLAKLVYASRGRRMPLP